MIYFNEDVEFAVMLPASGIAITDITVKYYKQGAALLTTKTLSVDNWKDVGDGLYIVSFDSTEIDALGVFTVLVYTLAGLAFTILERVAVRSAYDTVPINVCRLFGNIVDLGATPNASVEVLVRLAQTPMEVGSSFVSSKFERVFTDVMGNFYVDLVQTSLVILEIPVIGVRMQFTVPEETSVNIKDLIP